MTYTLPLIIAAALSLTACATKDFGRAPGMGGALGAMASCDQLKTDYAQLDDFERRIADKKQIDLRSVTGFWLDFGVGNMMDRRAAEKSARTRRAELDARKAAAGCVL